MYVCMYVCINTLTPFCQLYSISGICILYAVLNRENFLKFNCFVYDRYTTWLSPFV